MFLLFLIFLQGVFIRSKKCPMNMWDVSIAGASIAGENPLTAFFGLNTVKSSNKFIKTRFDSEKRP